MAQRVAPKGVFSEFSQLRTADLLAALHVPRNQRSFERTSTSANVEVNEPGMRSEDRVHTIMAIHADVDELVMTGQGKKVVGGESNPVTALWAATFVTAPTIGQAFPRGDIYDSQSFTRNGKPGWRTMLTASSVPKAAMGREGVAVVVDGVHPEYDDRRKLAVISASLTLDTVTVLNGFIQSTTGLGVAHEGTRIPVEMGETDKVDENHTRMISRPGFTFVRAPLRVLIGARARATVKLDTNPSSAHSALVVDLKALLDRENERAGIRIEG